MKIMMSIMNTLKENRLCNNSFESLFNFFRSLMSIKKNPHKIGTKSPNSSGIIAILLSIYNHGFSGIFESILSSTAEIVLYMLAIITVGILTSHFVIEVVNLGEGNAQINEL